MERRLNPRKNLQLAVVLECPPGNEVLAAKLCNISSGGAFLETSAPLSTSAPLIMAFKLAGTRLRNGIRLYARVIRRTEKGVGVAFLPMPGYMTDALHEALSRYEHQCEHQSEIRP